MGNVKPVYKNLLIAAIVIYVAGVTYFLADLYARIGKMEHKLTHEAGGHNEVTSH